jgi:alpha-ketoglutarate-dependent taurine dioxygenase
MNLYQSQKFQMELLLPFGLKIMTKSQSNPTAEIPIETLVPFIEEYKLVVLRGFQPMDKNEFLSYCQKFPKKQPLEWSFGPVMEMKENPNPQNYLFSNEEVPFHWDGAFYQEPDYLVFSCVEAPLPHSGGETLFTNTEMILNNISQEERLLWSKVELKFETEKRAHYGGSIKGPLVRNHPFTGRPILRFAEPVYSKHNPVHLEVFGISPDEQIEVIGSITKKVYDPLYCYKHEWQIGDLLFADNQSLIHGRTKFQKSSPRLLHRIQLIE